MSSLSAIYPSLSKKRVFITGGASGIGATLVTQFIKQGARVAFVDIDDAAASELIAQLNAGDQLEYSHCDIRNVDHLQAKICAVGTRWGGLDVLVNNAANDARHDYRTVTPEAWDDNHAINLRPQFFGIQAAAPLMPAGASIITMSSVSFMRRRKGFVGYTTAKAGIIGLTRTMAQELGPEGIRVNCVVPGAIKTAKQMAQVVTPALEQSFIDDQALKFRLNADDVAAMVLFLASDDARGCSGQAFIVDGGIV
jgi:NAD(P)-dependent dehydrogenase (short-subunit alcohol dehydrogenase family)